MTRRFRISGDPRRALSIEELRRMAQRRLPNFSWEYLEGGAEDEITLRRNRDVFGRIAWMPRTLTGGGAPDLATNILGAPAAMPLVIAPTGFNGLLWPDGDIALARAAAAAGIPFTLSTVSNCAVAQLVRAAPGRNWFQLYAIKDSAVVDGLLDRAAEAGCDTLVVTSDLPTLGAREWDRRNYRVPMQLSLASKLDALRHLSWFASVMLPHGAPRFENLAEFLPRGERSALLGAKYLATQVNPSLSWDDIARYRERWRGKLVVKGILCVEDARRAAETGADAIVISNHGGRQLDSAISALEVLPAIAGELGGQIGLIVDGGFRRGSDVLKAIALGADAVMIGRAVLYGLAAGGAAGAAHALALLRGEMERTMLLLGCHRLDELGLHLIRS